MNRRQFIKNIFLYGAGTLMLPRGKILQAGQRKKKVIVLGIDGMDPHMTQAYLAQGLLPNVQKIIQKGGIASVMSSIPPQSPVAWSNFIVGAPPRVHGIYDFIHRDPKTLSPYLSTSSVTAPARLLHMGDYAIPLTKGKTQLLRKGIPFWQHLFHHEIPATIFRMPANFPCENSKVDMISGMGTPDLRGGYGSYTVFTTAPGHFEKKRTGGHIEPLIFSNHKAEALLSGPPNTLRAGNPNAAIPFTVWRDPENPVARIIIQETDMILKEGELSHWVPLSFPMLGPLYHVKGICKIYLKSIHPEFCLYVSPLNIDPSDPALPILSSEGYGRDLTSVNGPFYTQGFPEDTKALSEGVLTEKEYLTLAHQVMKESRMLLEYELNRFRRLDKGLLFFYFSSLDQNTHMYFRTIDPKNPLYTPDLLRECGHVLKGLYAEIDTAIGQVLSQVDPGDPDVTIVIMSDHGFAPFRRQVNLNTWLYKNGYLSLKTPGRMEDYDLFGNVNWSRTGAYNLGINALYLNLKGREPEGAVLESQKKGVMARMTSDLMAMIDPVTGEKPISRVFQTSDGEKAINPHAPDLIVGWNRGYRTSWKSILGGFEPEILSDNLDKWSGDHCIDPALVPALLISNKRLAVTQNLTLPDITATLLNEFQINQPDEMTGRPLFKTTT